MSKPDKPLLKKDLNLLSVYALATGATLSSGFFLLPGIAFREAGPAMVLCYVLAAIPLIPAMFSVVELGSAIPRAGGAYYYLDRTMGPLVGTIGGLGTWLALVLKTAFALIGMGAYVSLYLPNLDIIYAAAGFAVIFALANLVGAKKAGVLQIVLVAGLVPILLLFIGVDMTHADPTRLENFFGHGWSSIISTTGLVYISYVGITKVASVAEEVQNPERNLPLGVFLAVGTAVVIYALGSLAMVLTVPAEELAGDLTPVATSAQYAGGAWLKALVTVAALLAFSAVANAGILSASRYPLAMGRDHLLPRIFCKLSKRGIPSVGIYVTVGFILLIIFTFDPTKIAKLASAFQLLLFAFICLAVVLMRESGLESYDPGFRSPLYPWMQIMGIIAPLFLIHQMGTVAELFVLGLLTIGAVWYFSYARERVTRDGAIFHVFERLGRRRYHGLDRELRGIIKEKGARDGDPYDEVILRAQVLDLHDEVDFESVTRKAAALLAERLMVDPEGLVGGFLQGTRIGATPVAKGAALPHLRLHGAARPEMVIVRAASGLAIEVEDPILGVHDHDDLTYALFFLVSPEEDPSLHLRVLAQLASHIDDSRFMGQWLEARDKAELCEIVLRDERFISLSLAGDQNTASFIGRVVKDIELPRACLITLIRRGDHSMVPAGDTVLLAGDRLTMIGEPKGIRELYRRFPDAAQALPETDG